MKMSEKQQQHQQQQSNKKKGKRSASKKKRSPFYPNTPSAVGSPTIGSQINRRTVRQLTPQRLCSLVLPPPLLSLFDADEHHSILDQHHARQTSNASVSAGSTSTLYNARLPSHIRVGFAKCDPLLVFDGKYVLVGTADGRIAVYSILEFDNDVSYDVKMSERRRRKEWEEEDEETSHHDADENNEKEEKKVDAEMGEVTEEENEWEIREIMNKKEKARLIEPLLVVTLPNKRKNTTLIGSEDDKGNTNTSLSSPPTIVDICATPKTGTSLVEQSNATDSSRPTVGDDFFGHAAILTDDGEVHILEFAASDTSNIPVVTIILSFDTDNSGATSICMRPACNGNSESLVRLCVGCDSGMLMEYQLHSTPHQDSGVQRSPIPQPLLRQRSHEIQSPMRPDVIGIERQLSEPVCHPVRDPVTVKVTLCWKGFVDAPIRSLSCPGWSGSESIIQSLLVVGTEQRQYANTRRDQSSPNNELSPAMSLEMINASLAESLWRKAKNEFDPKDTKHISLCDCSVWPAAGMELKYGWLHRKVPDVKQKPNNTIEQHRGSATSKICCFGEPQTCFASTASDGSVAISHCLDDGSWGVTDENNQVLFCHKVVGLGTVASGQERYLACCLRGGTMYLLPVVESSKSRNDIIMYATPVDSTDFGIVRYVHGFAAGLAQVKPWNNVKDDNRTGYNTKCTAMVAWSGGRIDVYELDTGESRDDHLLLQNLAEKGTIVEMS